MKLQAEIWSNFPIHAKFYDAWPTFLKLHRHWMQGRVEEGRVRRVTSPLFTEPAVTLWLWLVDNYDALFVTRVPCSNLSGKLLLLAPIIQKSFSKPLIGWNDISRALPVGAPLLCLIGFLSASFHKIA